MFQFTTIPQMPHVYIHITPPQIYVYEIYICLIISEFSPLLFNQQCCLQYVKVIIN